MVSSLAYGCINLLKHRTKPILLIQQIAPVDRLQKALTARFITPVQAEIFDYLYQLRESVDPVLMARYPAVSAGKPYPLGRCLEISEVVQAELTQRLKRPEARAERAIAAFKKSGGIVRPIWGALRGQFFQNATQIGALYVDVANDTVTVTKPKVEILPLDQSGMENIRDLAHFSEIADKYWQAQIVANHVAPTLAPAFPMLALFPGGKARLVSATDYMVGLMMQDRFMMAEKWLTQMPSPPPQVQALYRERLPKHLRVPDGGDGRMLAIAACQQARVQGDWNSVDWRNARMSEILELQGL